MCSLGIHCRQTCSVFSLACAGSYHPTSGLGSLALLSLSPFRFASLDSAQHSSLARPSGTSASILAWDSLGFSNFLVKLSSPGIKVLRTGIFNLELSVRTPSTSCARTQGFWEAPPSSTGHVVPLVLLPRGCFFSLGPTAHGFLLLSSCWERFVQPAPHAAIQHMERGCLKTHRRVAVLMRSPNRVLHNGVGTG